MQITISVITADIGSIGSHIRPSGLLLDTVRPYVAEHASGLLIDCCVSSTGDDIAIVGTHLRGSGDENVDPPCWDAFMAGTGVARAQGSYGAGQDLLKDACSGKARGMGPAVAELELEERPSEPFLFFAADRTDPGAFNLPLYPAFADPMNTPGLMLSPDTPDGFRFVIMDVAHTEGDRIVTLDAPEQVCDIAALLRDAERYGVESIWSRSTGEVLAPWAIGPCVAGAMRGSHQVPLMPVPLGSGISGFDGPPVVSCAAFARHDGRLTEPVDAFAHPFRDTAMNAISNKAIGMRRQGLFGAAMLPMSELEYTGTMQTLEQLDGRFQLRGTSEARH